MDRFEGKVVVVTGGAQGIGMASAQRFAGEGARVAILDIVEAAALTLAKEIEGVGFFCDVSNPESVSKAVQAIEIDGGRIMS